MTVLSGGARANAVNTDGSPIERGGKKGLGGRAHLGCQAENHRAQRFYEAVVNKTLTHSGDPRLARHVDNCVVKVDARGSRIAKDTKNSPRKIDLAVAAVMALDQAAVEAEAAMPAIY